MRMRCGSALTLVMLLLVPISAWAQASLTGTVRDSSGAVLPGVTVEAASDALIEKTRSAVTDGGGQYRIVDLPAGSYKATFVLPGFATIVRDAIASSEDPAVALRQVVHDFVLDHATYPTTARIVNYDLAALNPGVDLGRLAPGTVLTTGLAPTRSTDDDVMRAGQALAEDVVGAPADDDGLPFDEAQKMLVLFGHIPRHAVAAADDPVGRHCPDDDHARRSPWTVWPPASFGKNRPVRCLYDSYSRASGLLANFCSSLPGILFSKAPFP